MITTALQLQLRAANAGPVVVRLQQPRPGAYVLTAEYASSGFQVDALRRSYTDERTAHQAFDGMTALFLAGWTIAAVVDFGRMVAPATEHDPQTLTCAAEAA
jgi:hypothetical protein